MRLKIKFILGTAQFIPDYGIGRTNAFSEASAITLLEQAWNLGIDTLDTASVYAKAHEIIANSKIPFKIHTKLPNEDLNQKKIEALENSFTNQEIEVLYFHDPEAVKNKKVINDISKFKNKYFQYLGVSIYKASDFLLALENPDIDYIQFPLNILDRQFDQELLKKAKKENKQLIARSVFLQGLLTNNWKNIIQSNMQLNSYLDSVSEICVKHQISIEEAAIQWVKNHPALDGVIFGAESLEQLHSNYKVFATSISHKELLKDLTDISTPSPQQVDPRVW